MTEAQARVAVLIDADNISSKTVSVVLTECAKHGSLGVKRAYGNWASPHLGSWKGELAKHAITPVQQFAWVAGKNATDTALIIDAMDLLYSGNVDVFCIVSSDSDFTRLAMRLRESGRRVYGIGERKTLEAFTNACDRFTFVEVLLGQRLSEKPAAATPAEPRASSSDDGGNADDVAAAPPPLPRLEEVLLPAIDAAMRDDGWAPLSTVGWHIVASTPSFDARNYGYDKLGALVRDLRDIDVREERTPGGSTRLFVRRARQSKVKKTKT
jgi:uncharacterized protein (TIGR00288 family)